MMDYVSCIKVKDPGRCQNMLFLGTNSFHIHVYELKYLVSLETTTFIQVKSLSLLYPDKFHSVYGLFL